MDAFTHLQNTSLAKVLADRDYQLRSSIRAELLQSADQKYADLAGQVHDLGDESVADLLTDIDNARIERHVQELRGIVAARQRLAAGNINRCVDCGDGIGFERLLTHPVATRCIECQERHEKKYAHEAPPRM